MSAPVVISIREAIEKCATAQSYDATFCFSFVVTEIFAERAGEVEIADNSVYGVLLCNCGSNWSTWQIGSRVSANCQLRAKSGKGNKIIVNFVEAVAQTGSPIVMLAPPCAVVLSHSRKEVMMLHALTGHAYIEFVYGFMKIVQAFVNNSRSVNAEVDAALDSLVAVIKASLTHYRIAELETIVALDFIHRHEIPLRYKLQPEDVYDVAALAKIVEVRQLAEAEVAKRYTEGRLDVDPKMDLPSGHTDFADNGARCEVPLETAMRELREEAGLTAQDVSYIGTRTHRTTDAYQPFGATERHFVFFEFTATAAASAATPAGGDRSALKRGKRRTEDLGLKDFYNASSWVRPANIAAHMQYVDNQAAAEVASLSASMAAASISGSAGVSTGFTAAQRTSKFFTLRKFCLPADVVAVLDASTPLAVDAQDQTVFDGIRSRLATSIPTGAGASFDRFGSGARPNHSEHKSHLPPPPGTSSPAAGGNSRWNSGGAAGGAGAYRPPSGSANDANSFRNFTPKPAAPAVPAKPVSTAGDKSYKCDNCGSVFTLTASNQQYYADKGFALPKKCEKCRAVKKAGAK